MAQLAISSFQPGQLAAQRIELNMPRSGCGFGMRSARGRSSRSSSATSGASVGRSTMPICAAPSSRHCLNRWPITVVSRQGSSSLGRPIRDDAPAPRMTTPKAGILSAALMGSFDLQPWARIGTMNREVAQAFQPAGSGDFPVPSIRNTGQECPVNPQTGMSALPENHVSWLKFSPGFSALLNELCHHAHGDFVRAYGLDFHAHRTSELVELLGRRDVLFQKLLAHDA